MPQQVSYGSLQFSEQIAFFRRKLNLATEAWTDIVHDEHDHAFVVAGANRDDLVADFRAAVDKAIADGGSLADFRKDFDSIVEKYGWEYNGGRNWRSRVIYETNLRTSYAAGRYVQMMAVKDSRPFWRYKHSDSVAHPRPLHLSWNGIVLRYDDPWIKTHYCPNGWGCQCIWETLSPRDLERMGKTGPDTAPADDIQQVTIGGNGPSPRVVDTPAGVDPGWGYAPGADAYAQQLAQRALNTTTRLPATQAAESAAATLAIQSVEQALVDGFATWLEDVQQQAQARGLTYYVGAIDPDLLVKMQAAGVEPATAAIMIRDADALHALRDSKAVAVTAAGLPKALTAAELAELPQLLRDAQAVLLDPKSNSLLYVFAATRREAGKIVVAVNYKLRGTPTDTVNAFRTATLIDWVDVQKEVRAGTLQLLQGEL